MNLKEQKRKLIIFLILCLCILGLFILMISKSNSSSAAQAHEHKYTGTWLYDENLDCCYRCCTEPGCTEKQTQDCDLRYYHSGNLALALRSHGIDPSVLPGDLTQDACYPFCLNCKNTTKDGEFICRTIWEHNYVIVPEGELEEEEIINSSGDCIHKGNILKKCSRCGVKKWFEGEINPDKHDFSKYQSTSTVHWKVCANCGRAQGISGVFSPHDWGEPSIVKIEENSYYDIAVVEVKKYTCVCGRTKEEAVNPLNRCPSSQSPNHYHKWTPIGHSETLAFYECEYCHTTSQCSWERKLG